MAGCKQLVRYRVCKQGSDVTGGQCIQMKNSIHTAMAMHIQITELAILFSSAVPLLHTREEEFPVGT